MLRKTAQQLINEAYLQQELDSLRKQQDADTTNRLLKDAFPLADTTPPRSNHSGGSGVKSPSTLSSGKPDGSYMEADPGMRSSSQGGRYPEKSALERLLSQGSLTRTAIPNNLPSSNIPRTSSPLRTDTPRASTHLPNISSIQSTPSAHVRQAGGAPYGETRLVLSDLDREALSQVLRNELRALQSSSDV